MKITERRMHEQKLFGDTFKENVNEKSLLLKAT